MNKISFECISSRFENGIKQDAVSVPIKLEYLLVFAGYASRGVILFRLSS